MNTMSIRPDKFTTVACLVSLVVCDCALADQAALPSWEATLNTAGNCTARSYPDLERAIACHEHSFASCLEAKADDLEGCLREAVDAWALLAKKYAGHEGSEVITSQYDPNKCEELDGGNELLLQCQLTAYATQAVFGHIASIWGELPDLD